MVQGWDRDDLIALSQAQMLQVQPPHVLHPTKLWSLRGQRMPFCDRLALLRNQLGAVADDEIRYHLNVLKEECLSGVDFPAKEIVVVDPLVCAAWIDAVSFDCTEWAATHPEIFEAGLQVVGVFCFDSHWIPVLITPWGENVRIASFDATPALPDELASVLTRVVHALGFTEIHFDHVPRTFALKTVCGAVAINFLRSQVGGFPRIGTNFSAWEEHHCLRRRFMNYAGNVTEVPRPWFWGLGEAPDDSADEDCLGLSEEPLQRESSAPPNDSPVQVTVGRLVDLATGGVSPADLEWLLSCSAFQLLESGCPCIVDLHQLALLRAQLLPSEVRSQLLAVQFGIWSDDELRFHLHDLAHRCVVFQGGVSTRKVVVLDPLLTAAWTLPGSISPESCSRLFPKVVSDQLYIVGALRIASHWVPVLLVPCGECVQIVSSDFQAGLPAQWINCLVSFVYALGFRSIRFDHDQRLFQCRSACGAVAINFLAFRLGLGVRVSTYGAVWQSHVALRTKFANALSSTNLVSRPWVWGSGDDESSEHSWPSEDGIAAPVEPEGSSAGELLQRSGVDNSVPFSHVCITTDQRIDLFATHGRSMGDDEIRFHLNMLVVQRQSLGASSSGPRPVVIPVESLNFLNWNDVGHILIEKWCQGVPQVKTHGHQIVGALLEGEHWLPIWVVPAGMVMVVHTFDDIVDYDIFDGKLRWMGLHLGFEEVVVHRVPHGLPSHNFCGAHALAFLAHILLGEELPDSVRTLDFLTTNLRASFVQAMYETSVCRCPIVWGDGGTGALVKSLAEELSLHGVPPSQAENRASQAIKSIGSEPLLQAMQHKQPWKQLKALATNVGFKFVLPSELEATIATNRGKNVGRKAAKAKSVPGVPPPVELDPSKLVVIDGTFRSGVKPLPQLTAQQIGPVSSGFVLMTAQEAEPYLKAGRMVSQEPLALVVFHRSDLHLQSILAQSRITVPCRCTVDNEPVLAEATLVQIGNGPVDKYVGTTLVSLDSPDVRTLRFNVFRDEVEDWDQFVKAPVKHLVQLFPELRRCMVAGCTCPSWHNEEELPIKEPILDLWKRQYMKTGYKPVEAAKADLFCVSVRIPFCLMVRILNRSGSAGAYVEPRSADGQQVLRDFMVIWTSKLSLRELMHLKQTNPAVVGLARIGDRRGLRVAAAQAQEVHAVVRPDTLFLPQADRVQYMVGPFPFGLDRQGISKAMKLVNWHCRPLQPATPQPGRGAMWIVQAVDEPPNAILHTSHGEILISKHKPGELSGRTEVPQPIASPATLALCGGTHSKDDDPWSQGDPWQKFTPSTVPHQQSPVPTDSMQQMESRIQAAVLSRIPQAVPMEQDDVPDRISALEGQVQQLMHKQTQMDGQFQEFSHHHSQQVSGLQTQMQAQCQQLQGQMETQNQSIQAMFETQLSHIRGLLSKRPREDGE